MRAVTGETAQNARMQLLQTQYTNQFTALNTLLSQLQATSSYLTQALAQLPRPMSTNRNAAAASRSASRRSAARCETGASSR
jgi:septal ring factor EnvC (AmiA/AmiB activator)